MNEEAKSIPPELEKSIKCATMTCRRVLSDSCFPLLTTSLEKQNVGTDKDDLKEFANLAEKTMSVTSVLSLMGGIFDIKANKTDIAVEIDSSSVGETQRELGMRSTSFANHMKDVDKDSKLISSVKISTADESLFSTAASSTGSAKNSENKAIVSGVQHLVVSSLENVGNGNIMRETQKGRLSSSLEEKRTVDVLYLIPTGKPYEKQSEEFDKKAEIKVSTETSAVVGLRCSLAAPSRGVIYGHHFLRGKCLCAREEL